MPNRLAGPETTPAARDRREAGELRRAAAPQGLDAELVGCQALVVDPGPNFLIVSGAPGTGPDVGGQIGDLAGGVGVWRQRR
ncbi:hypothetical protein AB0M44_40000 [Streptosporangium subroseum]|uniref:hypothetical protein n=1 Tax=Streptosporangium subroseum TaxID=106412 RepID=UPI003422438A